MRRGTFAVRRASPGDAEALLDLLEAVAAEGRYIATEAPIDREPRRQGFLRTLVGDENLLLVADAGGEIIGSLGVEGSRGVGYVGMMVAGPWRSRGVGTALLAACVDWARGAGMHKLTLEVFPHNEAAIALYRAFGFEQEGYLRRHVRRRSGDLWDAIAMGLVLVE